MSELTLLVAYVRTNRRAMVAKALRRHHVTGWTEGEVTGYGTAAGGNGVAHIRFEVLVPSARAQICGESISDAAHTGADGDGLVLAMPALFVERISNRTTGRHALRVANRPE